MRMIEDCKLPETFDQSLLANASEMFSKWGMTPHMDEREYLFGTSGLASNSEDSNALKDEKKALCCVCVKMMDA